MGDDQSKSQPPPPPPSPFFSEPWRKINWGDNQSALQYVKDYRPQSGNQQLRILLLQKIRDIRTEASDLGIPQVVIFTKPDQVCPEIKESLKNVYKVKILKEKLEKFSAEVGIPMKCIFPVKNYHEEIDIDSDVDSLILSALRNIINFGDDNLNFKRSAEQLERLNKA